MYRILDTLIIILILVAVGGFILLLPVNCVNKETRDVEVESYEWDIRMAQDNIKPNELAYEDEWITLTLNPILNSKRNGGFAGIRYSLKNKTDQKLELVWDESSLILPSGINSQITHGNVRCIKAGESVLPTIIPPNAHMTDNFIFPISLLRDVCELSPLQLEPSGDTMQLFLTMNRDDQERGYDFTFEFRRNTITHVEQRTVCAEWESFLEQILKRAEADS